MGIGRPTRGVAHRGRKFRCYPGSHRKLLKNTGDENQLMEISV